MRKVIFLLSIFMFFFKTTATANYEKKFYDFSIESITGCEMAFKWGDQVVYQFQLTKNYTSTPVTRDYIYQ